MAVVDSKIRNSLYKRTNTSNTKLSFSCYTQIPEIKHSKKFWAKKL